MLDNAVRERSIEKAKGLGKLTNVMSIDHLEVDNKNKEKIENSLVSSMSSINLKSKIEQPDKSQFRSIMQNNIEKEGRGNAAKFTHSHNLQSPNKGNLTHGSLANAEATKKHFLKIQNTVET